MTDSVVATYGTEGDQKIIFREGEIVNDCQTWWAQSQTSGLWSLVLGQELPGRRQEWNSITGRGWGDGIWFVSFSPWAAPAKSPSLVKGTTSHYSQACAPHGLLSLAHAPPRTLPASLPNPPSQLLFYRFSQGQMFSIPSHSCPAWAENRDASCWIGSYPLDLWTPSNFHVGLYLTKQSPTHAITFCHHLPS